MNGKCAVLLKTNLEVNVIFAQENESMLDFCYRSIGCDMIGVANPVHLQDGYTLVCDEEFLLKNKPYLNFLASYFNDAHNEGDPLCGNVLILGEVEDKDGCRDFAWMNQAEAEVLATAIQTVAYPAFLLVRDSLTRKGILKEDVHDDQ